MKRCDVLVDAVLYKRSLLEHPNLHLETYENRSDLLEKAGAHVKGLLVRTVTKVDEELLDALPNVHCVGTASAGFDHLDVGLLEQREISWTAAPGCNANAVADYVIQSMRHVWGDDVLGLSVGIVGVGAVGECLRKRLKDLGNEVVAFDPPREMREDGFYSATLEELLQTDICTLHIPLSEENFHWLDAEKLGKNRWRTVINAARGGVADEEALVCWQIQNKQRKLILDVWEGEPIPKKKSLRSATLCTPHIAGYSEPAKLRATLELRSLLARTFNLSDDWVYAKETVKFQNKNPHLAFGAITRETKNLADYESSERGRRFRALRKSIPFRAELPN